jgi:CheY-like chemotaxis protein
MSELVILVVEDEPEVRAAIVRDLAPLTSRIRIDEAESVDDALAALAEAGEMGDEVGLILADHRLPGRSGVDLLVSLHHEPATAAIRKVLITGQASHADTIRAVNDAELDHYIAKPWAPEELLATTIEQLTTFVIASGMDPLRFASVLDGSRLFESYSKHPPAE